MTNFLDTMRREKTNRITRDAVDRALGWAAWHYAAAHDANARNSYAYAARNTQDGDMFIARAIGYASR